MAGPPESLTLRQRLDEKATETEQPPIREYQAPQEVRPTLQSENVEPTGKEVPPPPQDPGTIFDEFVRGHAASTEQHRAGEMARQARKAELAGDMARRDAFMRKAEEHLQRGQGAGPSVKSINDVVGDDPLDTLERSVRYALGLTGQSALSVTMSIAGGAGGRIATGIARRAAGIRKAGEAIDNAGAFAGASGVLYGDVRGGTILSQEMDPKIREQPVEQRERASLLTTAGSTALEAAVPAAIGARVGRRALARNRITANEVAGRVSGKGRLKRDMLAEGLTEVSQENLEQFSLHLQNPEQAAFASTEEGLNAFFGGLAGGAFGHGVGRTMEKAVDFGSRFRVQPNTTQFGILGSFSLDPKAQALATVLRGNDSARDAMGVIDQINEDLAGMTSPQSNKEFTAQLNERIDARSTGTTKNLVRGFARYFVALKGPAKGHKKGRDALITAFEEAGHKNANKIVDEIEKQLETEQAEIHNFLNDSLYDSDPETNKEKSLKALAQEGERGDAVRAIDSLKILNAHDEIRGVNINPDEWHFVSNAPEGGRRTKRHSPLERPEFQTIMMPAYIGEGGREGFELRDLHENMANSPYAGRLTNPFYAPDEQQNPYVKDAEGNDILYDEDRATLVTYATFLDAATANSGLGSKENYIQAAESMIEELQARIRGNTDAQPHVLEQHAKQIEQLQTAIEIEQTNPDPDALRQGDGTNPSLEQLFTGKYVIGAFKRQEIFDEQEPGVIATRRDMNAMRAGTRTTGEEDRKGMMKQRIAVLQKVPWAERQISESKDAYNIVYLDPKSIANQARKNRFLSRQDAKGKAPSMQRLISEGLSSVLGMPETMGIIETDAKGEIIRGDPEFNGIEPRPAADPNQTNQQRLDDVVTRVGNVLIKGRSNEGPAEYGTVHITRHIPARPISRKEGIFDGFYSGDVVNANKYWREEAEKVYNDPDPRIALTLHMDYLNSIRKAADESGIPEIDQYWQEAADIVSSGNAIALFNESDEFDASGAEFTEADFGGKEIRSKLEAALKNLSDRIHGNEDISGELDDHLDGTNNTYKGIKELRQEFNDLVLTDMEKGLGEAEQQQVIESKKSPFLKSLDQIEALKESLTETILGLNTLQREPKEGEKLSGNDLRALRMHKRQLQGFRKTLNDITSSIDEKLFAMNAEASGYIDENTDKLAGKLEDREGEQNVERIPSASTAPDKLVIDDITGAVTMALPTDPRLPEIEQAGVDKMRGAIDKALQLSGAMQGRSFIRKTSTLDRHLARHAFGFITDQKGARGVNVSSLSEMNPGYAVVVLMNSMENSRALRQVAAAAKSQGMIYLSPGSKVDPDAFSEFMAEQQYAQHPVYKNVYLTTEPLRLWRSNETWAAEMQAYHAESNAFQKALDNQEETDAKLAFVRKILWRANYWYNGPSRKDSKGNEPFNISDADRAELKTLWEKEDLGYELERDQITGKIKLRPVKLAKEEEQKARREEEEAQTSPTEPAKERQKRAKEARRAAEDRAEKFEQTAASQFKDAQAEIEEAVSIISDWSSKGARADLANFFNNRGLSDEERRMMRDLEKSLWKNKRVRSQIRELLQDKDIRRKFSLNDKGEMTKIAADRGYYYAMALQLATDPDIGLKLAPNTEIWFRKVIRYLARLLNIHMADFFGEAIMTQIAAGKLTNRNDIKKLYGDLSNSNDQAIENIANHTRRIINKSVRAAPDVLRDLGPEGQKLADLFAVPEADSRKTKTDGFLPRRRRQNDTWLNKVKRDVLEAYTELEIEEGWKEYRVGEPKSDAAKAIEKYVNQVYSYLARSNAKLTVFEAGRFRSTVPTKRTWRVPMAFNVQTVADDRLELQELFMTHGLDAEQSSKLVDSILWAGGHFSLTENEFDQDTNPVSSGTMSGLLQIINKNNAKEFEKFMTNDGDAALTKFTRQAVHKAEFSKSFGHNGSAITETLVALKARGLNSSELRYVEERVIPAMLGTLAYKMHPQWRAVMSTVISIQNMAILPLMIFPAMVDIWGITMATDDMKDGWYVFKRGMREIRNSFSNEKDAETQMAELLGIITDHSLLDRVGDTYNELMDQSMLRKWNQKFFYATGIEQWTKGIRIAAMQAGIKYIEAHRNDAKKLAPLGLEPKDVKIDSDGFLLNLGDETAAGDKIGAAINAFVDSTVLRPSAAHRPAWGSDPRWLFVWHLKQFTFTFHRVFLDKVIKEMQKEKPRKRILLPFLMMVPTMMASDAVKNIIAPSMYYENMSFTEHLRHSVSRSSILGIGTFGLDTARDVEFGKIPGSSLLGPTADSAWRFYDKGFAEGLFRLTPGYALWNKWFR